MPYIIALTGGIASGKSTASRYFAEQGIEIIDTDQIARDVVLPDSLALCDICGHFGSTILNADGTLNRKALRQQIFQDPIQREWLEALLHPLIRNEAQHRIDQATSPYAIVVIPLLHRDMLPAYPAVRRVLCIDVSETTQIQRLTERDGLTHSAAQAIIDAQPSRSERLAIADDVLENAGTLPTFMDHLAQLHQQYLVLSGAEL